MDDRFDTSVHFLYTSSCESLSVLWVFGRMRRCMCAPEKMKSGSDGIWVSRHPKDTHTRALLPLVSDTGSQEILLGCIGAACPKPVPLHSPLHPCSLPSRGRVPHSVDYNRLLPASGARKQVLWFHVDSAFTPEGGFQCSREGQMQGTALAVAPASGHRLCRYRSCLRPLLLEPRAPAASWRLCFFPTAFSGTCRRARLWVLARDATPLKPLAPLPLPRGPVLHLKLASVRPKRALGMCLVQGRGGKAQKPFFPIWEKIGKRRDG